MKDIKIISDLNSRLIDMTAERDRYKDAAIANYAWFYCEDKNIGNFRIRGELCNYAEHLTKKALLDCDKEYQGLPHLFLNPVALERADEEAVKELVKEVMDLVKTNNTTN